MKFGSGLIPTILAVAASIANGTTVTNETAGPNVNRLELSSIRPSPFEFPQSGGILAVGESRTVTISAKKTYNWLQVATMPGGAGSGYKYKFTVGSREWNNGLRETTAAGYTDATTILRPRFPQYKWMALVGAVYTDNELDRGHLTDSQFLIGNGRDQWIPFRSGWIAVYANDCWECYADNSRVVTLTIKRIE
jgi:hypothetical protein